MCSKKFLPQMFREIPLITPVIVITETGPLCSPTERQIQFWIDYYNYEIPQTFSYYNCKSV